MFNLFQSSNIIAVRGKDILLLDYLVSSQSKQAYYYNHIFKEWKKLSEVVNYNQNEFASQLCIPSILNNKDQNKVFVLFEHDIEQLTELDIVALILSKQYVILYNPSLLPVNLLTIDLNTIPKSLKAKALHNIINLWDKIDVDIKIIQYIVNKYNDLNVADLYIAFNKQTQLFDLNILTNARKIFTNVVQFIRPTTKPEFLVGFDDLLEWMDKYIKLKKELGNSPILPKGIIIRGVPGSGKTEIVKAIANKYYGELMILYPGSIYNKYVGASEGNIYTLINYLDRFDDGILLIDEIDKMLVWGSESVDAGVTKRVMGTFLTWLSERDPGLLIIGTTNKFDTIPPEMIRKGRFDKVFVAPDKISVKELLPKLEQKYGIKIKIEDKYWDYTDTGAEVEALILDLYRERR